MTDPSIQHLLDRQEISDVLSTYAHALDSRDWNLLASCFTEDAVAEYLEVGGVNDGVQAIVHACRSALSGLDGSQHLIGSIVVRLSGDVAESTCYLQAQHVVIDAPGGPHYLIAGTYADRLVRTPSGWRITYRKLHRSWSQGNPRVFDAAAARLKAGRG